MRENVNGWAVKQLIIWHEAKAAKLEGSIWSSIPCLESSIKTATSKCFLMLARAGQALRVWFLSHCVHPLQCVSLLRMKSAAKDWQAAGLRRGCTTWPVQWMDLSLDNISTKNSPSCFLSTSVARGRCCTFTDTKAKFTAQCGCDMQLILLVTPCVLHNLFWEEVADWNQKHPDRPPKVDPTTRIIPVVTELLDFYQLSSTKDERKIFGGHCWIG